MQTAILTNIKLYLDTIPRDPAVRILSEIKQTLRQLSDNPFLGQTHSDLTLIAGQEVRSRLCGTYRIYYRIGHKVPEIFAIRHTSRSSRGALIRAPSVVLTTATPS